MRTVILHAGGTKTGSSALQGFFARNRLALQGYGVHYPADGSLERAAHGLPTPGNARYIASMIAPAYIGRGGVEAAASGRRRLERQIARAPDDTQVLLYSSEFLQFAAAPLLREFRDVCTAAGYDCRVVYFVRHIEDWIVSAYTHALKRRSYDGSLEQFAEAANVRFGAAVRIFDRALGSDRVQVLSYDMGRRDIADYFLRKVLVPHVDVSMSNLSSPANTWVNRSLSHHEVSMFRAINAVIDDPDGDWSSYVTEALLASSARVPEASRYVKYVADRALERWAPDVRFLNRRLQEGEVRLHDRRAAPSLTPADVDLASATADGLLWVEINKLRARVAALEGGAPRSGLRGAVLGGTAELAAVGRRAKARTARLARRARG